MSNEFDGLHTMIFLVRDPADEENLKTLARGVFGDAGWSVIPRDAELSKILVERAMVDGDKDQTGTINAIQIVNAGEGLVRVKHEDQWFERYVRAVLFDPNKLPKKEKEKPDAHE